MSLYPTDFLCKSHGARGSSKRCRMNKFFGTPGCVMIPVSITPAIRYTIEDGRFVFPDFPDRTNEEILEILKEWNDE